MFGETLLHTFHWIIKEGGKAKEYPYLKLFETYWTVIVVQCHIETAVGIFGRGCQWLATIIVPKYVFDVFPFKCTLNI